MLSRRALVLPAVATAALAPASAQAALDAVDPPSPLRTALRAPVAGHVTVESQMRAAERDRREARLARVAMRLAWRVARARGSRPERSRLRDEPPSSLRDRIAQLRHELRFERVAIPPALEAIAACESGGDPTAIGGGGLYRGKYQFDFATWASVGGAGDPAAAPEAEQDMRAAMLYARAGATPWPVCGR
jgi:hypothetical protein